MAEHSVIDMAVYSDYIVLVVIVVCSLGTYTGENVRSPGTKD